ncbi:hypothetical protein PIB30_070129 [Stylosanthes scabra]|uniref:Arf-GAP domain-containing protein n=1 Tax=Stylosanthes scabra TaxID=79078 RepID=A0ABU6TN26_9FABA|nr:hypothetical protein [Stylosanthes scabra]
MLSTDVPNNDPMDLSREREKTMRMREKVFLPRGSTRKSPRARSEEDQIHNNTLGASRRLQDLQSQAAKKICVDCSKKNPWWASISYYVFVCLECPASITISASTSPSSDQSPWTRGPKSRSRRWNPAIRKTSSSLSINLSFSVRLSCGLGVGGASMLLLWVRCGRGGMVPLHW